MKQKKSLRFLALFLTLLLLVTALPLSVFARGVAKESEEEAQSVSSNDASLFQYDGKTEDASLRELTELREENVKHFALENGSFEAVAYGRAVHRKSADGKWVDIDNRLTLKEERGVKRFGSADERISFAASASTDGSIWALSENGYEIKMSLAGTEFRTAPSAEVKNHTTREEQVKNAKDLSEIATVDNCTTVVYRSVLPDVDLEYVLNGNDVKENILILSNRDNYVFSFKISLSGLIPKLNESGAILLLDEKSGEAIYELPAPYMTDAKGAFSNDVVYRLTEIGQGGYAIEVSASSEWINDPERAFPVAIDPTVQVTDNCYDTFIEGAAPNSNYSSSSTLWVSDDCTTLIRFTSLPTLPAGASLHSATLNFKFYYYVDDGYMSVAARQILENWTDTSATYNNAPAYATTNSGSTTLYASPNVTYSSPGSACFDLTSLFRKWNSGEATNYGIAIKRSSGSNMSVILCSKETGSNQPYFSIIYYPEANLANGIYTLKIAYPSKYIYTYNAETTSGTPIKFTNAFNYEEYKQFLIRKVEGNEYTIQPAHAPWMGLSTPGSGYNPTVTLEEYDPNSDLQRFTISKCGDNYIIRTKSSGFRYILRYDYAGDGYLTSAYQYYDVTSSEKWILTSTTLSSGVYCLRSRSSQSNYNYANAVNNSQGTFENVTNVYSRPVYQTHFSTSPQSSTSPIFTALFKIIYRPATQDYIIRSMMDNLLILHHISNNPRLSKRDFVPDDTTLSMYTWRITRCNQSGFYIWYETSGGSRHFLTMPSSGNLTTVTDKNSATIWNTYVYSGTARQYFWAYDYNVYPDYETAHPGDQINVSSLAGTYNHSFYSTVIGVNTPGTVSYSVKNTNGTSTSVASITSSTGILTFNPNKCGVVRVQFTYSSGFSFTTDYCCVPTSGYFFAMQNVMGSTGYAKSSGDFATNSSISGGTFTDTQLWQRIPCQGSNMSGYYYIKNVGSGKYLSAASDTTMDADLVMVSSATGDRQAWKFTQTSSGQWKIRCRRDELAGNNLYINVNPSTNRLIQGTFVLNSSYYDEFNLLVVGTNILCGSMPTRQTLIDPSQELMALAMCCDPYSLQFRQMK